MSVFHRVDDVRAMPAQRFINLAIRLSAYTGVIQARVTAESEDATSATKDARAATQRVSGAHSDAPRRVNSDAATLATDPGLGGMFEIQQG